ncbi:four helix bundle protein [Desulfobacter postgatei]|jgi:four helix bundle protein|uniref:S23 ribosomal protein n=1 Tax=Desulfobacter postgatei 2ac9 TaxID=879212 RepID=I5B0Z6_9BACT|nr:four helix bundle protein [Desulfobacter postgatei]EIM63159.1 S23 ribosomal protein [Desulfobacter postgatei 2ac9]
MREPAKSFQDLIVWQKAHAFVLAIYSFTQSFPKHELYGLTSQLRRAAISIPANIAEGFRKQSANDKARFLNISEGSLEESRYYLILAKDLKYISSEQYQTAWNQSEEVGRLLNGYRSSVLKNKGGQNA